MVKAWLITMERLRMVIQDGGLGSSAVTWAICPLSWILGESWGFRIVWCRIQSLCNITHSNRHSFLWLLFTNIQWTTPGFWVSSRYNQGYKSLHFSPVVPTSLTTIQYLPYPPNLLQQDKTNQTITSNTYDVYERQRHLLLRMHQKGVPLQRVPP